MSQSQTNFFSNEIDYSARFLIADNQTTWGLIH